MSPPTTRSILAVAVKRVNLAFGGLTAEQRERVHLVADGPLDAALLTGDRAKSIAAIEAWRDRQLAAIAEAEETMRAAA